MNDHSFDLYVCPQCKGVLQEEADHLHCSACMRNYPIVNGIPDFLLVRSEESQNPYLRDIDKLGRWARLYDTPLWYPLVLSMYAGPGVLSFDQILAYVRKTITPIKGLVIDVATGPGTYGRRVAGDGRTVYGIDISQDMMSVGMEKVKREGISGMHFSRADVEALPFGEGVFAAGIASGCLHLFPDTLKALHEISRTLLPGAPLVVVTFAWGDRGILKYDWARQRIRARGRMTIFDIHTLPALLDQAGFDFFDPDARGGVLLFRARKR